ncbi:hypothetical protein [Halomarina ordinaria]|uniref:ParB N-terminal domain-containing protein n=1 Tax=Halomarina ordinaria TaxID=3033939 RepID=A0ABD5U7V5_9EURY|nr:hypothetical protein [Halomarina sp. PSRA2]
MSAPVRVEESAVVDHWLRLEEGGPERPEELPPAEALDALLTANPGAASFLWQTRPARWYHLRLSRAAFGRLHVIDGPPELGWRALSPDGTVREAARRIDRRDAVALPAAAAGVDVDCVERLTAALAGGASFPAPVATTRRGCAPTRVADGNHRAAATALHLRRTGEYRPLAVYVGVGAAPVVGPLRERVCGALRRFVGRDRIV